MSFITNLEASLVSVELREKFVAVARHVNEHACGYMSENQCEFERLRALKMNENYDPPAINVMSEDQLHMMVCLPFSYPDVDDEDWKLYETGTFSPRLVSKLIFWNLVDFSDFETWDKWITSWPDRSTQLVRCWFAYNLLTFQRLVTPDQILSDADRCMQNFPKLTLSLLLWAIQITRNIRTPRWRVTVHQENKRECYVRSITPVGAWHKLRVNNQTWMARKAERIVINQLRRERQAEYDRLHAPPWWHNFSPMSTIYDGIVRVFGGLYWQRWGIRRREPQSDESRVLLIDDAQCPPLLRIKIRSKTLKILGQLIPVFSRHLDKMTVLCKQGVYANNLGAFDHNLFNKQRKAITASMITAFEQLKGVCKLDAEKVDLPVGLYPEACFVNALYKEQFSIAEKADYLDQYISAIKILLGILQVMSDRWFNRTCDCCTALGENPVKLYDVNRVREPQMADAMPGDVDRMMPMVDNLLSAPAAGGSNMVVAEKDVGIAGEQKESFVFADQRPVDVALPTKSVTVDKTAIAASERNWDVSGVMSRPMLIDKNTWLASDASREWVYMLPYSYFSSDAFDGVSCQPLTAANFMSMFGMTRFNMRARLTVNSTKFQLGVLIMYFVPFYMKERSNFTEQDNATNYPHVFINAADSNSGEIEIPWQNMREYFPLYADSHAEYNYWGELRIAIWNRMAVGDTTSQQATWTLYMWLENVENHQLCSPRGAGKVTFAKTVINSDFGESIIPDGNLWHRERSYPRRGFWEPQMEMVMGAAVNTAAKVLPQLATAAVEGLAGMVTRTVSDKPANPSQPVPMVVRTVGNLAIGDGMDGSQRLSLSNMGVTPSDVGTSDTVTAGNFSDLTSLWSRFHEFPWNVTDEENSVLYNFAVTPMVAQNYVGKTVKMYSAGSSATASGDKISVFKYSDYKTLQYAGVSYSMLGFLANMFQYWSGDLVLKLQIACTPGHSGRLLIRYEPTGTTDIATTECQRTTVPGVLWDIQEKHEIEIVLPYMSVRPFLSTKCWKTIDMHTATGLLQQTSCGVVQILVINELKRMTGVASEVRINAYLSAGKNFELAVPSNLLHIASIGTLRVNSRLTLLTEEQRRSTEYGKFLFYYLTSHGALGNRVNLLTGDRTVGNLIPFADLRDGAHGSYNLFVSDIKKALEYAEKSQRAEFIEGNDYVSQTSWWDPNTAKTLEDAISFLRKIGISIPIHDIEGSYGFDIGSIRDVDYRIIWHWFAIAHMRYFAWNLSSLPSNNLPRMRYAVREPQMNSISSDKAGGDYVNPFKDGTTRSNLNSTKMFGESHMDMYKLLRRYTLIDDRSLPLPYNPETDVNHATLTYGAANEADLAKMWMVSQIPVTPCQMPSNLGKQGAWADKAGDPVKTSLGFMTGDVGANWSNSSYLNMTTMLSTVWTWWRGSLRWKIWLSGSRSDETIKAAVIYSPHNYSDWEYGSESTYRMAQESNMGIVLFNGNVMGALEFETPFYSPYARLHTSFTNRSAITTAGVIRVYVKAERSSKRLLDGESFTGVQMNSINMQVFQAVGDDFEFSVPRAAPTLYLWHGAYKYSGDDNWRDTDFSLPSMTMRALDINSTVPDVSSVERKVISQWSTDLDDPQPVRSSYIRNNWPVSWLEGRDEPMTETESANMSDLKNAIENLGEANTREPQMADEDGALVSDFCDSDTLVDDSITRLLRATPKFADAVDGLPTVVSTITSTCKTMNALAETLNRSAQLIVPIADKTGQAISMASNGIASTTKYALNSVRMGTCVYSFYNLLKAETWQERWMAVAGCVLAVGLSPDVVMTAGEWLLSSISQIFSPNQVHEGVREPQAWEDDVDNSWGAYIEKNVEILKMMAAGIFAIMAFYITKSAPTIRDVGSFCSLNISKLKNFTIVGGAFKTFDWLFGWIGKLISKAAEWIGNKFSGGIFTRKTLTDRYPEVVSWATKIEFYGVEANIVAVAWNPEERLKVWKLIDEGRLFLEKMGDKRDGFLAMTIRKGLMDLEKISQRLISYDSALPVRMDPCGIWISGSSGQGKSALTAALTNFVGDELGLPQYNRTYCRPDDENVKYYAGYVGQPMLNVDDVAHFPKGPYIKEYLLIHSNVPYKLPMNLNEEKGREAQFQVTIENSNIRYPNPNDCASPESIQRRATIRAEMRTVGDQTPDFKNSRFDIYPSYSKNGRAQPLIRDLTTPQFFRYCADIVIKHLAAQRAFVFSCLRGRRIAVPDEIAGDNTQQFRINFMLAMAKVIIAGGTPPKTELGVLHDVSWEVLNYFKGIYPMEYRRLLPFFKPEQIQGTSVPQMESSDEDEVLERAHKCLSRKKKLTIAFKELDLMYRPHKPHTMIVANRIELERFRAMAWPDEVQAPSVDALEAAFEGVNGISAQDERRNAENEDFLKEEYNKFYVKVNGNWELPWTMDELLLKEPDDIEYLVQLAWDIGKAKYNDTTLFNKRIDEARIDKSNVISRSVTMLKKWFDKEVAAVNTWFKEHNWVMNIMKTAGVIAGLFLGYKALKFMFSDLFVKIENKLSDWFAPILTSTAVVATREYTRDKITSMRDTIRHWLSKNEQKEFVAESGTIEAVEKEIKAMLPSAVALVKTRKLAASEMAVKHNPYMAHAQTRLHRPQSEILDVRCEAQGADDKMALDIRKNKILPNFCKFNLILSTGQKRVVSGIFIRARTLLLPAHPFADVEDGLWFSIVTHSNTMFELFDKRRMVKLKGVDVIVYETTIRSPAHADISKHFIREDELNFTKTHATLNCWSDAQIITSYSTVAVFSTGVDYKLHTGEMEMNDRGFDYDVPTNKGDCGAVLMVDNPAITHKLLGIHVCGVTGYSEGFSALVTYEMLDEAFGKLPGDQVDSSNRVPQCLIVKAVEEMKVIPQGDFTLHGAVANKDAVRLPMKTEIIPSPIHDLVRQHVTEPSVLTNNDERNKSGVSPLRRAIEKYGKVTFPFPFTDREYVSADILSELCNMPDVMERRLLTDYEAVFGNEDIAFLDRMNLSSSAGYKWNKIKPSGERGKAWLYDEFAEDGIRNLEYRESYLHRESEAKLGRRVPSIWTDCLKDERRPLAKNAAGKTRSFMIAEADLVQLIRKYFMAFCTAFYSYNGKFFSAVGMDPYSYQWTKLYKRLVSNSPMAFAGDFGSYDGTLDADLIMDFIHEVNAWYDEGGLNTPEDNKVRLVIGDELIHTVIICINGIYEKHRGNGSGNPITVILNTVVNEKYMRLSWLGIMRKMEKWEFLSLYHYHRYVKSIAYGDDNVLTIHESVVKWFNQQTVTEYLSMFGLDYTDESKQGNNTVVKPLIECTFLKNGFKLQSDSNIILAPISEDTIYELTNWVRKSDDDVAQMRENLEDCLRFAFHHGREFFVGLRSGVNKALRQRHLKALSTTYSVVAEEFYNKLVD